MHHIMAFILIYYCIDIIATAPHLVHIPREPVLHPQHPQRPRPARRPAGRWAMTRVMGDFAAVDRAWNLLYKSWLPASRLDLRAAPAEEVYHQTPAEIGWERFDVTLALPIKT